MAYILETDRDINMSCFLFRYDKTIMALCVGIHPELSPWEEP